MKTRKSGIVAESQYEGSSPNICKKKVRKLIKSKEVSSDTSYRDTHNIGRRKSTNNVVTYSLNSHLFFDIYAKFDKNQVLQSKSTTQLSRKSNRNSLENLHKDSDMLLNSMSGDTSTDVMDSNENGSNNSSPKHLKMIDQTDSVKQDEDSLLCSPSENISPFKSPSHRRISSTKKVNLKKKFQNDNSELSETLKVTFPKNLENKSFVQKLTALKKKTSKLKPQKCSRRRNKVLTLDSEGKNKIIDETERNKNVLFLKKRLVRSKCKIDYNSKLSLKESTHGETKCTNGSEDKKIVEDSEEGNIELAVDFGNNGVEAETINLMMNVKGGNNFKNKNSNVVCKDDCKEDINIKYSNENDKESFVQECINEEIKEEKQKFDEKGKSGTEYSLSVEMRSKKVSKKSLSCFFDITTTGSQRECERSTVKNTIFVDVLGRPRDPLDQKDQGKVSKNGSVPKKVVLIVKKDDETRKQSVEDGDSVDTLWLWHGDGQEKTIQLQLNGEVVTRTCYPAIKHTKDDVVIAVMDCVMLRSADQEPYLAKIIAFFTDEESGKKMMSVLWYYRPEHTDRGRLPWHTDADVYASKHLDTNSVDCIEDKAYVLPPELYCRFMSYQKRQSATTRQSLIARLVPTINDDLFDPSSTTTPTNGDPRLPNVDMFLSSFYYGTTWQSTFPSEMTTDNVFVCRGIFDMTVHKVVDEHTVTLVASHVPVATLDIDDESGMERCVSVTSAMSISSDSDSSCSPGVVETQCAHMSPLLLGHLRYVSPIIGDCQAHSGSFDRHMITDGGRHHSNGLQEAQCHYH